MSLLEASHDSLPYLDPPLTDASSGRAKALIASEFARNTTTPDQTELPPHPLLPSPFPPPHFPPLIAAAHARLAGSLPAAIEPGIDASRYESLAGPDTPSPDAYRSLLAQAYTSTTYLSQRHQHLGLLDAYGKNAFLLGNAQLEGILGGLERELKEVRERGEGVERERWEQQEGVRGEVEALTEGWKAGVGKLVEVLVGTEGVRGSVEGRRREGAGENGAGGGV